jgi:hypothetical protein
MKVRDGQVVVRFRHFLRVAGMAVRPAEATENCADERKEMRFMPEN